MCSFFWFRISMEFNTWCSHTCMVRMVETLFNRKHPLLVTYKCLILELLASIKLIFHTVCHRAPCNNFFLKKRKKVYLSLCHRLTLLPLSFPHSRRWIALQSPYSGEDSGEDNLPGTPKSRSFIQWGLYEMSKKIILNGLIKARCLLLEWLFHRRVVQKGWKSGGHDGLFLGLSGRTEDW